jgi:hypothetical protein
MWHSGEPDFALQGLITKSDMSAYEPTGTQCGDTCSNFLSNQRPERIGMSVSVARRYGRKGMRTVGSESERQPEV